MADTSFACAPRARHGSRAGVRSGRVRDAAVRHLLGVRVPGNGGANHGKVKVDKYTIAVDPGIVINPLQLKRQIQGGAIMGISQALHEEMTFDEKR